MFVPQIVDVLSRLTVINVSNVEPLLGPRDPDRDSVKFRNKTRGLGGVGEIALMRWLSSYGTTMVG